MTAISATNELCEHLAQVRILPLVSLDEPSAAKPLGRVLAQEGFPIIEIVLRTSAALDAITAAASVPGLCVGAGTVTQVDQVQTVADAGARFVVCPGLSLDVAAACAERGLPLIPGVATATEIQTAHAAGITTLKLFPAAPLGGPATVRALSAAFPDAQFVPTGGITSDTFTDYLAIPTVLAVGGSWLAPTTTIDRHNLHRIAALCRAAAANLAKGTAVTDDRPALAHP